MLLRLIPEIYNIQSKKMLRVVFMGTPEFAVHSLDALVKAGINIVGVVTAPDKPAGRGLAMKVSDVKKYAEERQLLVLQPEKLKNSDFIQQLRLLKPDLAVVVAFRMLPEEVWAMPKMGTINLHASLLPQYRGAAPINWAIINGEKKTGVTTFFIEKEIDTGKIIAKHEVEITDSDTAGSLHDKLAAIGAQVLVDTVNKIEKGTCLPIAQEDLALGIDLLPAPKIFRESCRINWGSNLSDINNFIRGLSPYPGAWTTLVKGGEIKTLKILEGQPVDSFFGSPRQIIGQGKTLLVSCEKGSFQINKLQLEGKKPMLTNEFLRGIREIDQYRIK